MLFLLLWCLVPPLLPLQVGTISSLRGTSAVPWEARAERPLCASEVTVSLGCSKQECLTSRSSPSRTFISRIKPGGPGAPRVGRKPGRQGADWGRPALGADPAPPGSPVRELKRASVFRLLPARGPGAHFRSCARPRRLRRPSGDRRK